MLGDLRRSHAPRFKLLNLGGSRLDAPYRRHKLDHQQRASVHVQLVLVMYTPSFRPFVSEIVIRWSAGRPAASRLCKQKDRRIDRRSFR